MTGSESMCQISYLLNTILCDSPSKGSDCTPTLSLPAEIISSLMLHSHWSGHLSCATFGAQCFPRSHRAQPSNERRQTDWGSGNWILPVLSSVWAVVCVCAVVSVSFFRDYYSTKASALLQCTKPHIYRAGVLLWGLLKPCFYFSDLNTPSAVAGVMHDWKIVSWYCNKMIHSKVLSKLMCLQMMSKWNSIWPV